MSAHFRIKVEYKDSRNKYASPVKFVYRLDTFSIETIEQLTLVLQELIAERFGYENLRLAQLKTEDAYILMKDDFCSRVLENNDRIICVDMHEFIKEHRGTINSGEKWVTLEQYDNESESEKKLAIGKSSAGQLYIHMIAGELKEELYLFDMTYLFHLNIRGSPPMLMSGTSPSDWFIKAEFKNSFESYEKFILTGSLKSSSKSAIESCQIEIPLNTERKKIERWKILQSSQNSQNNLLSSVIEPSRLEQLKAELPPPSRTGPTINTLVPSVELKIHECEGNSSIQIVQGAGSVVDVSQEYFSRNGSFRNFVHISNIILSNKPLTLPETVNQNPSAPVEKAIAVTRVNVQYQQHNGDWVDCQDSALSLIHGEKMGTTQILNVESDKLTSIAVTAVIPVKGEPNRMNYTRSRAHRSLPQPLKLKIILTDNISKTCSLIVEQLNQPLVLMTKEKFLEGEKDSMKKLVAYLDADDCQYDERLVAAIYINNENCLVIKSEGRSVHMEKSTILNAQSNARKKQRTEELIDFISTECIKAVSLFDPETFLFYAIRIELTTTTSETIETVLIPVDEIQ